MDHGAGKAADCYLCESFINRWGINLEVAFRSFWVLFHALKTFLDVQSILNNIAMLTQGRLEVLFWFVFFLKFNISKLSKYYCTVMFWCWTKEQVLIWNLDIFFSLLQLKIISFFEKCRSYEYFQGEILKNLCAGTWFYTFNPRTNDFCKNMKKSPARIGFRSQKIHRP